MFYFNFFNLIFSSPILNYHSDYFVLLTKHQCLYMAYRIKSILPYSEIHWPQPIISKELALNCWDFAFARTVSHVHLYFHQATFWHDLHFKMSVSLIPSVVSIHISLWEKFFYLIIPTSNCILLCLFYH